MIFVCWTFAFLFFATLAFYIYNSFKANLKMQKISSLFLIPFASLPIIISLNKYLPDSSHIRFLSIMALIFIVISNVLFTLEKKITYYVSEVFFALNIFMWIQLYKTTFYIFKFSLSSMIVLVLFHSLLLFLLLVYIRKKSNAFVLIRIFIFYSLSFLNFSALISAKNINHNAYTFTFLIATILFIIFYILYCIQCARPSQEIKKSVIHVIRTALFSTSQILMMLTGLLMIR